MTVKELICELKKFDENAIACVGFNGYTIEGTDEITFDVESEANRVLSFGPGYTGAPQVMICEGIRRFEADE